MVRLTSDLRLSVALVRPYSYFRSYLPISLLRVGVSRQLSDSNFALKAQNNRVRSLETSTVLTSNLLLEGGDQIHRLLKYAEFGDGFVIAHVNRTHSAEFFKCIVDIADA